MRPRTAAVAGALAGTAAGLGVGHLGPAVTSISMLRRRLVPSLSGVGRPGHVALTFDDGPDPASTPRFLEMLDLLGWQATFFMLGDMTRRAPGLAAEVAAEGHEVGVHGDVHTSMLRRTPAAALDDVRRGRDSIAAATGAEPVWYRPPYGTLSGGSLRAARRCGLRTVLWTAWGRDWRPRATPETVAHDVLRGQVEGGTILLHDSDCTSAPECWHSALGALPLLARTFDERGLTVGPLGTHGIA